MKRALVTGASGMLGTHVVKRLVAAGWDVRGLVRSRSSTSWVELCGAEGVVGRLEDRCSISHAASGCDAIFNAAAAIGPGADWAAFSRANVQGLEHVVAAASATGARLVHVSSTAVFGRDRYRVVPMDASVPLPTLPDHDAYGRSKQEGERVVLHAHGSGRVWACVLRPPMMYGRYDRQFVPRLGPWVERGLVPLVSGGRVCLSLVHADAVAEGALRASTTESAGGSVYHLTNDFPVSAAEVVNHGSAGLGCRPRALRMSLPAARLALGAVSVGLRLAGRSDLARRTGELLEMLYRDNPFTSARARRELGWAPTIRPAEGLPEAFRWWKERQGEVR